MICYGRRFPSFCLSFVSLVVAPAAQAGVYSLKAVRVNERSITPTDTVAVCPGDTIMAEVYLSEWSPAGQGLETWQAQLEPDSIVSGSAGVLLPLGWDAALDAPECTTDGDCAEGLHCETRICVGPDHDPDIGAYIDPLRPNYVYASVSDIYAVDNSSLVRGYRYGGTVMSGTLPIYAPPPKYGGTLILVVSDDAQGTFEISFLAGPGTFMKDDAGDDILPIQLQSLFVITSGPDAPPCHIVSSDPGNCAIDPLQPSNPDGSDPAGWAEISLTFDGNASDVTMADFSVDDSLPGPPEVQSLTVSPAGDTVTLTFDRRIRLGRWTCVTFIPRDEMVCIGALPGDVDGDGTSDSADVGLLIDELKGTLDPPLTTCRCDIDRSGTCRPPDLLREIDLLNGGDTYNPWLGGSIFPGCPSVR
jgi:hypothetical protein